jgi:hypothetical protein
MFAKLYETPEHGQILVMLDSNDEGEPVIKYCCKPEGLGVCYALSPPFENSDQGWGIAEQVFAEETKESTIELIEVVILTALEEMEVVEVSYEEQRQQKIEQILKHKHKHTIH